MVLYLALISAGTAAGQDDETRQATGLPRLIGENTRGDRMNISGRITLNTPEKLKRLPIITITANYAGKVAERAFTNDTGYYLLRNVPRQDVTLVVEVDGMEVARQMFVTSPLSSPRYDFSIPWPAAAAAAKPGVISADQVFVRTGKNEELYLKAVAAAKAKETAKAIDLFSQLLAAEPNDFVAWTELGTVYFKDNSLDNAEGSYFKAIELKKDYAVALLNLGKLYVSRKQFDNAILVLSNAAKSSPDSSDAQYYLGESYLQVKKGTLAVVHLNEALRLAPVEKAEIHLRLATLYDAAKMKNKAAEEYKMFLGKRPDHPEKSKLEKYIAENSAN